MAQRRSTARRARPSSFDARLVEIETTLTATLEALPDKIGIAVRDGLKELEQIFRAETNALTARVAALELARAGSNGEARVQSETRSQGQEWARTLAPYGISAIFAGAALVWRSLGG